MYSRDNNEAIKMSDFEIVNQIGEGSISVVYLVRRKSDNEPFAMKCIKKELILDDNLLTSTKLEKEILTKVRTLPVLIKTGRKSFLFEPQLLIPIGQQASLHNELREGRRSL